MNDPLTIQMALVLNRIWGELSDTAGNAFIRQHGFAGGDVYRKWLHYLRDLSPEAVAEGFAVWMREAKSEYAPNLLTLRKYAKAISGRSYPSTEKAYQEACRLASQPLEQHWSHSLIYFAGRAAGWYELRTQTRDMIFPAFREHYLSLVERAKKGEVFELPLVEPELAKVEQKPTPKAEALRHLSNLKNFLEQ